MTNTPQVVVDPRCPECGSLSVTVYKTQMVTMSHDGTPHHANRQKRQCSICGFRYITFRIKEPVSTNKRRVSGPWAKNT